MTGIGSTAAAGSTGAAVACSGSSRSQRNLKNLWSRSRQRYGRNRTPKTCSTIPWRWDLTLRTDPQSGHPFLNQSGSTGNFTY